MEIGFLSNPGEREQLKSDAYQTKVAASIYEGIMRYFTKEKDLKN
ncbi:N-acetylmuramoyl-L-alanine amidase [Veillonella atypica]|nr:N-acetylmuramoyl-L-alanine amidase [Veillonella atypica]